MFLCDFDWISTDSCFSVDLHDAGCVLHSFFCVCSIELMEFDLRCSFCKIVLYVLISFQ